MPQLTLYLDQESARLIGKAARREAVSLSRWAREKLVLAAGSPDWPKDYKKLIGKLSDSSFQAPGESAETLDQEPSFPKPRRS